MQLLGSHYYKWSQRRRLSSWLEDIDFFYCRVPQGKYIQIPKDDDPLDLVVSLCCAVFPENLQCSKQ